MKSPHAPDHDHLNFLKVDAHFGRLRLAFLLIGFFIFWSFLATLVSYNNPLPQLPALVGSASETSTSLAGDVLSDILAAYFSSFTLLNLATFLLLLLLGFRLTRALTSEALQLSRPRLAGRFLRCCAFFLPRPGEVNPQHPGFPHTDEEKIAAVLGGPCSVEVEADNGLLIENRVGSRMFLRGGGKAAKFRIEHGERLLGIFSSNRQEFNLNLTATCADGARFTIQDMRISVMNPAFLDAAEITDGLLRGEQFNFSSQAEWNEFISETLRLEIMNFILEHDAREIRDQSGAISGMLVNRDQKAPRAMKSHHLKQHGRERILIFASGGARRSKSRIRKRRRLITPELRSTVVMPIEVVKIPGDFAEKLQHHLAQAYKVVYNNAITDLKIIQLGVITFNEIPANTASSSKRA